MRKYFRIGRPFLKYTQIFQVIRSEIRIIFQSDRSQQLSQKIYSAADVTGNVMKDLQEMALDFQCEAWALGSNQPPADAG